jgi:DNA-directed RNA polymerase subunit alpha
VNVGRGFVAFDTQDARELPRGVIPIDAIYSPIRHVNFTIEHVGQFKKQEQILLEITTDETISPDEALRQGADILRRPFLVLRDWQRPHGEREQGTILSHVPIPSSIYERSVGELDLPLRIVNILRRVGMMKIGPLLEQDAPDLLALRNIGEKTLQEIGNALRMKGWLPNST